MAIPSKAYSPTAPKGPGVFSLLVPYKRLVLFMIIFALLGNGINLLLPKIIANAIDAYPTHYIVSQIITTYLIASLVIFIFTALQNYVQVYASEKVAKDLRTRLATKLSVQSFAYIEECNPSKLLTNLTADVDSIKMFVSQAIVSIASSIIIIIGACILLFSINWRLALAVVAIVPVIGGAFFFVLKKVRVIFIQSRQVIDRLNKVINESILGSAIIRVINSQHLEYEKFLEANKRGMALGMSILKLFAALIPIIIFTANLASLAILTLGGRFVIGGSMTLGDFAAFSSYLSMLIFPILVIGFMSNVIAQATASYSRISSVLNTPVIENKASVNTSLTGKIELKNVSVLYGQKPALKNVSFEVKAGSSLAIIGPTGAGKTQLLYLLTGLIKPSEGTLTFDGVNIDDYIKENFYSQVGFVFQDSILFNMSIRENIAFNKKVDEVSLQKAIETAELKDFIDHLPDHLDTIVTERGSSLSGGQKQRIMLARALAINPKILLLDDFTARVDSNTEMKILNNLKKNYPDTTLLSVTQKIDTAKWYDLIIVLMEGEIVATGIHADLIRQNPEYIQIYNSQQSTSNYELQSK